MDPENVAASNRKFLRNSLSGLICLLKYNVKSFAFYNLELNIRFNITYREVFIQCRRSTYLHIVGLYLCLTNTLNIPYYCLLCGCQTWLLARMGHILGHPKDLVLLGSLSKSNPVSLSHTQRLCRKLVSLPFIEDHRRIGTLSLISTPIFSRVFITRV